MTLHDFLSLPEVALPLKRKSGDIARFYKEVTDKYFAQLSKLDRGGNISAKVLDEVAMSYEIRDLVLKSFTQYLDGHPGLAYEALKNMVEKHIDLFRRFVSKPVNLEKHTYLYRLRLLEEESYSRKDLFHIPFDKRHLVKTQRYSIPGFPSLYLSSSIYTAWKELGCPDLNKVVAVRMEPTSRVTFINFPAPPQYFTQQGDMNNYDRMNPSLNVSFNYQTAHIIAWPLLAACSISVLERNAPFKPEYIIPQLVLQLVRNNVFGNDIHGVRYFSLHFGNKYHSMTLGSNYVFPVKKSQTAGHCRVLKGLFKVTEPVSWQLANTVTDEFDKSKAASDGIEIIPGTLVSNQSTQFARVEVKLIEQNALPL